MTDDSRLARVRERFLTAEPIEPGQVRETILASWRCCRELHVAAGRIDLSYARDPDLDTPLTRNALPVLQSLRDSVQGEAVSVILTDAHGATDHEVLAATQQAYTAQGGLHHICYLGITAMDEPALAVPAQWPTGRVIRPGDVVTCEISAAAAPEFAGQVLRTFTVGAPPTALYAELHAVATAAFNAIARALVPGARARDLAAAAAVIGQAGFTAIDDLAHGFGGGYLSPVVPAPGRPLPAPEFMLAAGMTVVVQPNVVTRDGHAGVQTGELLLVTEHGPQRLHAYPQGLQQAG
jgi:Xaa-Pro aminopeptidase